MAFFQLLSNLGRARLDQFFFCVDANHLIVCVLTREDTSFNPVFELLFQDLQVEFLEPKRKRGNNSKKSRHEGIFQSRTFLGFCEGGKRVDNIFQIPFQDLKCESQRSRHVAMMGANYPQGKSLKILVGKFSKQQLHLLSFASKWLCLRRPEQQSSQKDANNVTKKPGKSQQAT